MNRAFFPDTEFFIDWIKADGLKQTQTIWFLKIG
jgi:hypothetical protein